MEDENERERQLARYRAIAELLHETVLYYDRAGDTLYLYGRQSLSGAQSGVLRDFCAKAREEGDFAAFRAALCAIVRSERERTDDLLLLPGGEGEADRRRMESYAHRDEKGTLLGRVCTLERVAGEQLQLAKRASRDPLTGLYNRYECEKRITQDLRSGLWGSLLFLDLDGFKRVNDTLGHAKGDLILQLAAKTIRSCFRESDELFRLGGDEFVVWLQKPVDEAAMKEKSALLAAAFRRITQQSGLSAISVSIGVAPSCAGDSFDSLYTRADGAMYAAKRAGHGGYQFARESPPSSEELLTPAHCRERYGGLADGLLVLRACYGEEGEISDFALCHESGAAALLGAKNMQEAGECPFFASNPALFPLLFDRCARVCACGERALFSCTPPAGSRPLCCELFRPAAGAVVCLISV